MSLSIIVICIDLDLDREWSENITWIHDCDFELLNTPDVRNIVLFGSRAMDYKLRLLIAGVPEDRISVTDTYEKTPEMLRLFDNESVIILTGMHVCPPPNEVEARIVERMKEKLKA